VCPEEIVGQLNHFKNIMNTFKNNIKVDKNKHTLLLPFNNNEQLIEHVKNNKIMEKLDKQLLTINNYINIYASIPFLKGAGGNYDCDTKLINNNTC